MSEADLLNDPIIFNKSNIIFDLDDTIYDSSSYYFGAFGDVANYLRRTKGIEVLEWLIAKHLKEGIGYKNLFNDLLAEFDIAYSYLPIVINIFQGYDCASLNPQNSLSEQLQVLKNDRKKKLFLVTNGDENRQWRKIDRLEIRKLFEKIIVCDPNVEPYILKPSNSILELLKIPQGDKSTLVVGDSLRYDGQFAKNCGFDFLHYKYMNYED